jgi:hypothetical protein
MATRHGKTPLRVMSTFFTRDRFGEPQFIAGLLLLVFLAQCLWLVERKLQTVGMDSSELFMLMQGLRQWHGHIPEEIPAVEGGANADLDGDTRQNIPNLEPSQFGAVADPHRSALFYLVASAPLLIWHGPLDTNSVSAWGWLAHVPFLFFGVMLGASLWYVARRLYGNAGGYVALMLYCFAPGLIRASAIWYAKPETGACWGAFGSAFTAIAVAHTLYAPREVVLWNWRRILLLGISLALAVGSQFSLIMLAPLVLGLLLYLAPDRRRAGAVIWAAACLVGGMLIFLAYLPHPAAFWNGVRQAHFFGYTTAALGIGRAYRNVFAQIGQICPALVIALPPTLLVYVCWRRARYFGNSAPLLMAGIFLLLGLSNPHFPGFGFRLIAIPFLFLFVAGVTSDLMESRFRSLVQACVWGLLSAYGAWSLMELAKAVRT